MRRLFYLLLFISVSINLLAQNKKSTTFHSPTGKVVFVSKQSVSGENIEQINNCLAAVFPGANEHLSYHGVQMDCDAPIFRERLTTRLGFKYEYVWNGRYNKNIISGPLWKDRSAQLNVFIPKNGKQITGIGTGYHQTTNRALAERDFRAALVSVIEEFPKALVDYRVFNNQSDGKMEYFSFRIVSQETQHILGSIYLILRTSADKRQWSVRLNYIDYNNTMAADKIKYGVYDLSYLTKPYCNSCIARMDDNAITFKIQKNGMEKIVVAFADDFIKLKKILFQDQMSDYGKQEQLGIYLEHLYLDSLPAICYTNNVFDATNPQEFILMPSNDQGGIKGFGESLYHEYFGEHSTSLAKGAYGFYENY